MIENEIEYILSDNYSDRPLGINIDLLVIHNISLPPNEFDNNYIVDFFTNKLDCSLHQYFQQLETLRVSSHFLIKRCGKIINFVPMEKCAWHAGRSNFNGRNNCNDFSIGIELEGADHIQYTDQQYKQLIDLTKYIQTKYPLITKNNIIGHSDIAPDRKTDPGNSFDWGKYLDRL